MMQKQSPKEMSIPAKLRQILRFKPAQSGQGQKLEEFVLTPDILKDIGSGSSINVRLRTLKRLMEDISGKKIENVGVEAIWVKVSDLFDLRHPRHTRQSAYEFIHQIVITQYEWLGLTRVQMFELASNANATEDLIERIELVRLLTNGGNNIEHLEDKIGPFLYTSISPALGSSEAASYLKLLNNIIKFNSVCLDAEVINHIVSLTCHYARQTSSNSGSLLCVDILDSIICFSWPSLESLECVLTTLCFLVNVKHLCQLSLKLAKKLMGTHLGHSALYIMCNILEDPYNRDQVSLLRGSIFFIGMFLWGGQRVSSLKITHAVVLPYFIKSLAGNSLTVAVEVSFSIQRLVKKYYLELQPRTWDLIMDILDKLVHLTVGKTSGEAPQLSSNIHEILTTIEEFYVGKEYNGCEKRLFYIIEMCAAKRPESSVMRLIHFRASLITPSKSNWLGAIKLLADTYYKQEMRTSIRVKVLKVLEGFYSNNRDIYGDEIVEMLILFCLNSVENEKDVEVRHAAVELFLIVVQDCNSKACLEILDILSKIVEKPFDQSRYHGGKTEALETVHVISESEITDVKLAILGLINLFEKKLYVLPSAIAIQILKVLLRHLHLQYDCSLVLKDAGFLRVSLYECLLKLRSNEKHQLGILNTEFENTFSPYLYCSYSEKINFGPSSPPVPSLSPSLYATAAIPTYLNLETYFKTIIVCLKEERDWVVLKYVLQELPRLLQNKTLLLSASSCIGELCQSVCSLIGDQSLHLPECLRNVSTPLTKPEFYSHVYPIESAFVSYHKYITRNLQYLLVINLKHGLTSRCAPACISALSICNLEMTGIMVKLLPDVLLSLSKISATVHIASSILEFLSILVRMPKLYNSFVHEQYMSIFAVAVPYTNPYKYNHYTVSLAYHVITVWFIKCRIPLRRNFVSFILKGLRNNVINPLDENVAAKADPSHDDKEAEKGSCRSLSDSLIAFHYALVESFIDLLNRFTFSGVSTLPDRGALTEFLLNKGSTESWIVGNSIITISTSGCSLRTNGSGLCQKCWDYCVKKKTDFGKKESAASAATTEDKSLESSEDKSDDNRRSSISAFGSGTRRRHHSAAVRRSYSVDSKNSEERQTQDDLHIVMTLTKDKDEFKPFVCSCWCSDYAEVTVRRPTGSTSWFMRIRNRLQDNENSDFPLDEVAKEIFPCQTLYKDSKRTRFGHERINSESLDEKEQESLVQSVITEMAVKDNEAVNTAAQNPVEEIEPSSIAGTSGIERVELRGSLAGKKSSLTLQSTIRRNTSVVEESSGQGVDDLLPAPRDRCNTIAVMSPIKARQFASAALQNTIDHQPHGIDPKFVFLQLFHSFRFGMSVDKPVFLPKSKTEFSLMSLDYIQPHETHKISVLYVGEGQCDSEVDILANEFGSVRYAMFLHGLGHLIRLNDVNAMEIYLGGLEVNGSDGKYSYVWKDDVMQATLMPNKKSDPKSTNKKLHVGNNFVAIVYNDSGRNYNINTIRSQFMYAIIVIKPLDHESNLVTLKTKIDMSALIGYTEPKIISDQGLAIFVRQMALHANLASLIFVNNLRNTADPDNAGDPYASNGLERLKHIRRLRDRRLAEVVSPEPDEESIKGVEDFTRFM